MDQISTISSSKTYNWRYVCKFIVKNIMWREFWYFKTDQEWKLKIFFTNFSIVLTWFWRVDIYICSSLMVKLCKRGPKLDHQIRLAVEHNKGIPEVRTRRGSPSKCERDKSSKENRIFGKYLYYTSMFVYSSISNISLRHLAFENNCLLKLTLELRTALLETLLQCGLYSTMHSFLNFV